MTARNSRRAAPRLRFDKVALRLVQGVREALDEAVPDGLCVLFSVTAPIKEPSKTATALIETIRQQLSVRTGSRQFAEVLFRNEVRVRIVSSVSPHAARIAGFVHNPNPPPDGLLDVAQSLLKCVEVSNVARCAAPDPETLRHVRKQLFAKISRAKVPDLT